MILFPGIPPRLTIQSPGTAIGEWHSPCPPALLPLGKRGIMEVEDFRVEAPGWFVISGLAANPPLTPANWRTMEMAFKLRLRTQAAKAPAWRSASIAVPDPASGMVSHRV